MGNKRNWTVYAHIVPKELSGYANDKYYIGITSQNVQDRWKRGNGYKKLFFEKAINKYGWDNIRHEVLLDHLTKKEACDLEDSLIRLFKSNQCTYGYNIANGGIVGGIVPVKVAKYDITGELLEVYDGIREARSKGGMKGSLKIGTTKLSNGFQWRHAEENKIIKNIGSYSKNKRVRLAQYDLEGHLIKTFNSINSASNELGFPIDLNLSETHGYMFRRIPKGITPSSNVEPYIAYDRRKTVEVYDLNGNKIEELQSITAANNKYGLNISSYCSSNNVGLGEYQFKIKGSTKEIKNLSNDTRYKTIYLYDIEGNFIDKFSSFRQAILFIYGEDKQFAIPQKVFSSIYANAFVGHRWWFEYVDKMPALVPFDERCNPIVQLGDNDTPIDIFSSAILAAKTMGASRSDKILKALKKDGGKSYGYKWCYFTKMKEDDFKNTCLYEKYLAYKDILINRKGELFL